MFLLVSIAYAGVWLALAMLFSILFRSTATAALVSLGVWLFLALLWPALAQLVGEVISPSDIRFAQLGLPTPDTVAWQQGLSRLSPGTLYGEAVLAMLSPEAQSLTNLLAQFQGRIMGAPLPLGQSILSAWPQMVEPDRRHDPALRGGLRRLPAPGGAGLSRMVSDAPTIRTSSAKSLAGKITILRRQTNIAAAALAGRWLLQFFVRTAMSGASSAPPARRC